MAKPKTSFINAFEPILLKAWGSYRDQLDDNLLEKTREALAYIRRVYRFRGELGAESPSHIDYREAKNRAGYLAAFGERHAYLAYSHLKKVQAKEPSAIPMPDSHGELTVTIVGAGPAVETYGLCLFYNEHAHELKHLTLNLIEKVNKEWQPTRDTVISGLIREAMPRIEPYQVPIEVDIKEANCINTFATHHDSLISTNILIIYNVLNEIEANYAPMVLRNLRYITTQCTQTLLVLVAEPTVFKAWPRIKLIRQELLNYSRVLVDEPDGKIDFLSEPTNITMTGLNERLFGRTNEKNRPLLETSLNRVMIASQIVPPLLFEPYRYEQLQRLLIKRGPKGKIVKQPDRLTDYQLPWF